MREFEKQSEMMDMKEEMMNDAIDDAMGDEADEEERSVRSLFWSTTNYFDCYVPSTLIFFTTFSPPYYTWRGFCSDAIVNQVLDELGLEIADDLSGLKPADQTLKPGTSKVPVAAAATDADADLEARLENLKRQ